jgi:hypothetical protein
MPETDIKMEVKDHSLETQASSSNVNPNAMLCQIEKDEQIKERSHSETSVASKEETPG